MRGKPADEIVDHFQRLVSMGCMVSGMPPQLHHCKGGSMREIIGLHGMSMKSSDWLCIPLAPEYHTGKYGIERGVESWEAAFSTQIALLIKVCDRTGVDVFAKAGVRFTLEELRERYEARTDRQRA